MYTICLDFDGTVVDHCFPKIGQAVPGALKSLQEFSAMGAKIILFTMRCDYSKFGEVLSDAVNFLTENGIPLYGINNNPSQFAWTQSSKVYGHVYIDDLAAGTPLIHPEGFNKPCVDWAAIVPSIKKAIQNHSRGNIK
jgi:ribonucleotide monophosphatase NagD (HAD superfamily)